MKKTLRVSTGHTLCVKSVDVADLPKLPYSGEYKTFYVVRNWDENGHIFLYLAKGNEAAPNQIVAWYPNTKSFWSSFGTTIEKAIEGAFADAFKYA